MCTISYLPLPKGYALAFSRDEQISRPRALAPSPLFKGSNWLAPKDPLSNGTWIAFHPETGDFIALYNGAFIPHQKKTYVKSRGQVIPALLSGSRVVPPASAQFLGMEPFSLLERQNQSLTLHRWDGRRLFTEPKEPTMPFQLSSCTLYAPFYQKRKEEKFLKGIEAGILSDAQGIASWHRNVDEDSENGIRIARKNGLHSISLTVLDFSFAPLRYTYEAWD